MNRIQFAELATKHMVAFVTHDDRYFLLFDDDTDSRLAALDVVTQWWCSGAITMEQANAAFDETFLPIAIELERLPEPEPEPEPEPRRWWASALVLFAEWLVTVCASAVGAVAIVFLLRWVG